MMDKSPVSPVDPKWKARQTLVVGGVIVQLTFLSLAIWQSEKLSDLKAPTTARKLVGEVLTADDLVFPDTEMAASKGEQLPPVDVGRAAAGTPAQLQAGKQLFSQHCASCHGALGRGDGAAGLSLDPRPRDLASANGWKKGTRLSDVFRTVTLGLQGTKMPAFDYLRHEDRFALAHHVISLAPGRPGDTAESLAALDREFSLAQGTKAPSRIPVSRAIERMLTDAAKTPAEAELSGDQPGRTIFLAVVEPSEPDRVPTCLTSDTGWRTDVDRLKQLLCADPTSNGFRPRIRLLDQPSWALLQGYLKTRYPEEVVTSKSGD